ncbi:universal stress protein [Microvirga guangxiensis]|uniref:Nucleotide-binding universal stress protein, UspA family n=1 Tax=Microvirga guangxiensis TaxID=549386 RepID=A0A1G5KAN3_9HYPH|nr:universal stress protein [Microvirga guangxiensis]SCY97118.1 Nucleotide-binding universal stress protein, UspA family [Microvirga guangxiensis]
MRLPLHITLATDLSARSDRAFERAVQLAREWNARLSIVHAIEGHQYASWQKGSSWRWSANPVEWGKTKLRREYPGWDSGSMELEVKPGDPYEIVKAAALQNDTDLMIGGVARDEPYGRDVLGRLIGELTRTAPVPVLVVKKRLSGPYRRVVVASDLSEASQAALQLALRWFPADVVTLYHAIEAAAAGQSPDDEVLAQCRKWIEETCGERAEGLDVVAQRGEAKGLLKYHVEDHDVDLLVIGTHGRSGIAHALLGSVAAEILQLVKCDILVVRRRS